MERVAFYLRIFPGPSPSTTGDTQAIWPELATRSASRACAT